MAAGLFVSAWRGSAAPSGRDARVGRGIGARQRDPGSRHDDRLAVGVGVT